MTLSVNSQTQIESELLRFLVICATCLQCWVIVWKSRAKNESPMWECSNAQAKIERRPSLLLGKYLAGLDCKILAGSKRRYSTATRSFVPQPHQLLLTRSCSKLLCLIQPSIFF